MPGTRSCGAEKKLEMKTREQKKQHRRQVGVKLLLNSDLEVKSFLQVENPLQQEQNSLWGPRFSSKAQPCFPNDGHKGDFFLSKHSYIRSPSPFQEGTVLGGGPRQGQP